MTQQRKPGFCCVKQEFQLASIPEQKPSSDDRPLAPKTNNEEESNDSRKRKRGQNKGRKAKDLGLIQAKFSTDRLCSKIAKGEVCEKENCKFTHNLEDYKASREKDISSDCPFQKYSKCPFGVKCLFSSGHKKTENNTDVSEKLSSYDSETTNSMGYDLMRGLRKKTYKFVLSEDFKEKKRIDFSNKIYVAPLTTLGNLPFRRIVKEFGADVTCGEMAMARNLTDAKANEWALVRKHESEDIFGIQLCDSDPGKMSDCVTMLANECEFDFIDFNCGCPIDLVTKYGAGSALLNRENKLKEMLKQSFQKSRNKIPIAIKMRKGWNCNKPTAHKLISKLDDWRRENKWNLSYVAIHGRSRQQRYTKLSDWQYISQCCTKVDDELQVIGNGDVISFEDWNKHLEKVELTLGELNEVEVEEEEQLLEGESKKNFKERLTTCLLARGVLVKPWLCQEIKEQKHIDISSKERLEMIEKFCTYGLQHWGSDRQGVNNTRRYLLEWMSFLHRYVPVGVIEPLYVPQQLNERPPRYKGRDDLETLMASTNVKDWIKISEMFLGNVHDDYTFVPKHRANAYESG